jgi:uncharacterized protein with NRDE domain
MCILVLARGVSERWPLLLAANRDEAHARPSAALARWADAPGVIAGRDLLSGGSWLGVSEAGRLCAVTNRRGYGAADLAAPSRGALVTAVLEGADPLAADLDRYNPVNLVAVDGAQAVFRANRPAPETVSLGPGMHGVSNGDLDEPSAKIEELKRAVSGWLQRPQGWEPLFTALRSEAAAEPGDTPHGAVFVRNAVYGSRSSTVVAVRNDGAGVILERRFDAEAQAAGESEIRFRWNGALT